LSEGKYYQRRLTLKKKVEVIALLFFLYATLLVWVTLMHAPSYELNYMMKALPCGLMHNPWLFLIPLPVIGFILWLMTCSVSHCYVNEKGVGMFFSIPIFWSKGTERFRTWDEMMGYHWRERIGGLIISCMKVPMGTGELFPIFISFPLKDPEEFKVDVLKYSPEYSTLKDWVLSDEFEKVHRQK
jgi:hypothetical protein